jgi:hypothetical protein
VLSIEASPRIGDLLVGEGSILYVEEIVPDPSWDPYIRLKVIVPEKSVVKHTRVNLSGFEWYMKKYNLCLQRTSQ